jgi:hypothetical protein
LASAYEDIDAVLQKLRDMRAQVYHVRQDYLILLITCDLVQFDMALTISAADAEEED